MLRLPVAAFLRDHLRLPVGVTDQPDDVEHRFWARMARSIMRRKWRYVLATAALLLALAVPVAWLQLTPGATAGIPQSPQSVRGLNVLKTALGPGAIAPAQVLVDTGRSGGVSDPAVQAAIGRLVARVRGDPEAAATYYLPGGALSTARAGTPRSSSRRGTSTARRRRRRSSIVCATR